MHEPGDRIAQKYRVERLLDRGGMGEVYVCVNEKLGKRVAIKLLDRSLLTVEGAAERFTREAIAASAVRHRGVVEIYDADVLPDGRPWIAMELLEGESLQARLDRERIIPADDAISIASDVLDVLAAVHGAGIVHRDLKPGNLFLERLAGGGRRVKVLDFGIAKVTSEELGKLTRTGTSMGTPHYFAPEQATAGPIDARTDLYAMGVVIFEMLTGDKPYVADNFGELVRLMYTQGPRSLSAILPAARDRR
ncbi:MAG: serine/threonine protein kinase [Sandaracinaceae bacterium]|nr:serine/threonine protein kinase [Sandaracinaceae bacterium]